MFITLCDACGSDTSTELDATFDYERWRTPRVCQTCARRFYHAVGATLDEIRAERNVTPRHMPTQAATYDRWRAIRPLLRAIGKIA